jgi:hypothetical protein
MISSNDPVDCKSRLVGFITIETAACPASRGLVEEDASLGQALAGLARQTHARQTLRGLAKCGGSRPPASFTQPRMALLTPPRLSADLGALASELEQALERARRAVLLNLAG